MSTTTRDIHAVLTGVAELARTAYEHWDADRDTKVGKILLSLAGYLPGYDYRADAVQAALAAQKPTENIREGYPYDDPAFEALCREQDVWGTALAALCAVFWREAQKPVEGDAKDAARYQFLRDIERDSEHDGAIYVRQIQVTAGVITGSAVLTEEYLDAAIDAIAQQGKEEK